MNALALRVRTAGLDRALGTRATTAVAGGLIAAVLVAALIGLAALPTGSSSPAASAPADSRISARRAVAPVHVLLLAKQGRLRVAIAYHRAKGWFGLSVDPAPPGALAAWTATRGSKSIPALSAIYGHTDAATARVTWRDGKVDTTAVGRDGNYLVVRRGHMAGSKVELLNRDGSVATTVQGP
jgi:hypothetical protein